MTNNHIEGTPGIRQVSRRMSHLEGKMIVDTVLKNEQRIIPVGPWITFPLPKEYMSKALETVGAT